MSIASRFIFWILGGGGGNFTPPVVQLRLSDFNRGGRQYDMLALFEVGHAQNFYADSNRGGSDVILDGEIGLGAGETLISRIRYAGTNIIINNDSDPVALAFGDYFGTGNTSEDAILFLQTLDGVQNFVIADYLDDSGDLFIRLSSLPTAFETLIDDLAVNDRFILAITAPVITTTNSLKWGADSILWGSDKLLWS